MCSDISVFREMFDEQEVTFFELGNTNSLVNAIEKAFENSMIKGNNAYLKASNNYTSKRMGIEYLSLYKKLIHE